MYSSEGIASQFEISKDLDTHGYDVSYINSMHMLMVMIFAKI